MDTPAHMRELESQGLRPIDLVVCNLYPFQQTVADPQVSIADAVEQIDIGGVTLIRAAAKNHARVTVVVDPADYGGILNELGRGGISQGTRERLAYKAFAYTAAYDEAIRSYLEAQGYAGEHELFPERLTIHLERQQSLRYGENPHQRAALYRIPGASGPLGGRLRQGKPLSYNNILDLEAAWRVVCDFDLPTVAILKHNNPCGLASAALAQDAYPLALAGDPVSAFGGIVAVNVPVDEALVSQLGDLFVECIVAPGFACAALHLLQGREAIRVLEIPGGGATGSNSVEILRFAQNDRITRPRWLVSF
jgi:phosphoribosylaminoimidazolecarboxamide formyltransferase/IMP cyclohydrolase